MSTRKTATIPQRKSRQISRQVTMNPSKGLNNLVSPALIDNKEFSDALNIQYDEGGVARKRDGYVTVGAALTASKGLGMFVTESLRHLTTIDSGTFKYRTTGAWTSVGTISFTAASEVVFTQARSALYIWNGTEGGSKWDGTTLSRPGTMPKASFAIFYQTFHIAAGVAGQPNRIFISQQDDASAFTRTATVLNNSTEVPGATVFSGTTANFIDVRKDDGDRITALGRYQDIVIIFKERSIYQLSFDSSNNPVVTPITGSTGCVSHKSVENVENDLYFLSREGVRVLGNEPNFFTAIRTNVLSIRIQTTIDSINQQYYSKANAHYFDNKYLISVPTTTSAIERTLVYDRRFQSWSVWDNFNANSYVQYVDTTNRSYLYFLNDTGTQVYQVSPGTYSDSGVAINAYLVSKAFDLGNPDITKYFDSIGLVFRRLTGMVDVSIYTDDGLLFGTATIGQGSNNGMGLLPLAMEVLGAGTGDTSETQTFADTPERVIIGTNTRSIKFKIQNNTINEGFVFLGYILAFIPYTHYQFDSSRKIYT